MSQSHKLLPCPFCGGEKLLRLKPTCKRSDPYDPMDRTHPIIRCMTCYAEVCGKDDDHSADRRTAVNAWNTRTAPQVKPLVWEGFRSGAYEITITAEGVADLHNHGSLDEDGESEFLLGGFLTLVTIADLKGMAQDDHERRILSALE